MSSSASFKPYEMTATEISTKVLSGELSMQAVTQFYIERTEKHAKSLNTHLYWNREHVLSQTALQEKRLKNGERLPLAGVPVLIKDNICMRGTPTTCSSKILSGFKPPYDADVIERLQKAGAIFFGKANCDEFAMGSSNENSAFGPVKNPWNLAHVPGGSSGGSAAAVAADLCPVSLGSDTGGSIRQPASFCGVVGLKPTYGRVSRYGLVAFGSSLDQIGPFTRTVSDCALVFDVLSGHDPKDSTSLTLGPARTAESLHSGKPLSGLKIGLVSEFFGEGLDQDTRAALDAAVALYKSLGAEVKTVSLPHLKYSIAAYYVLATAEASSNLARFDGVRYGYRHHEPGQTLKQMYKLSRSEGFGREVKQRIMLGTFVLSSGYYDAFYAKANRVRHLIADDFAKAFKEVDLLLSPTSPTTAFKIGEKVEDPLSMYLSDICTIGVNLAGIPGVSIPCGFDRNGLPIGMQLMAPHLAEEKLLKGAHLYEQAAKWHTKHKPSFG